MESEKALVHGQADRPDKVRLQGSPAQFLIRSTDNGNHGPVEASAPVIEYLRNSNSLKLSGGATLKLDDEIIRSTEIEFDIDTEQYSAGGHDGVSIEVPPSN